MPIEINKDISIQVEQLKSMASDDVDNANLFFLRKQFSSDFGGEELSLSTNHNALSNAAKGLEILGYDLILRYYKDTELQKKAANELLWPAYRIQRSIYLNDKKNLEAMINKVFDGLQANRQPEIRLELE